MLPKLLKITVPFIILGVAIAISYSIFKNPPKKIEEQDKGVSKLLVDILAIKPRSYTVLVQSYGNVRPKVQSQLITQVSGQIVDVSKSLSDGSFFKKDDVLIKLDDRDYRAEVKIAESELTVAQQTLLEEEARSQQAQEDWKRLHKDSREEPNELVLRIPQLNTAKAMVVSAEARLQKANLDLERTEIIAPYDGRILHKKVDIGQVVSANHIVADIYATDHVEVRLPVKNRDLPFIKFPESEENIKAVLSSNLVGVQEWSADIVRTEGVINDESQQLYVVAQVHDPFKVKHGREGSIKVGQYVNAEITGKTVDKAIIIPNQCIYQGSYVYVVKDGVVERREIEMRWQNSNEAMIARGLQGGDELVLTPLGRVSSGTAVKVKSRKEEVES